MRQERRKLEIFLRKKRYDRIRYKKTITTTILFYLLFAIPVLAGQYPVTHVVDGDTIDVIYQGHKERSGMLNLNTPESVYPDQSRNTEMGRRASAYTESRPGGETVDLEFQAKKRGKYARLPAYVILDGRNFNIELVRKGWSPEMNSQSPPIKKGVCVVLS